MGVSRESGEKIVRLTYHPQGIRWATKGDQRVADAIATIVQWVAPRGEMGPANDYSQLGASLYFMDLDKAVAKANQWLNTPVSGRTRVIPVVGGQAIGTSTLAQHRTRAIPGWKK